MLLYPGKQRLAVVTFDQDYASSNLSNKMRKRQYWLKEGSGWHIIHEGSAVRREAGAPESGEATSRTPKAAGTLSVDIRRPPGGGGT